MATSIAEISQFNDFSKIIFHNLFLNEKNYFILENYDLEFKN